MDSIFNCYIKKEDEFGNVTFEKVRLEDVTICGKSIEEIASILIGLEIEKITGIEVTMKNLDYLLKKIVDEKEQVLQEMLRKG